MASKNRADAQDDRWGDHIPWSLRYQSVISKGDWTKFFSLISIRLSSLIRHEEAKIPNETYFLDKLSSESLGRFVRDRDSIPAENIRWFFSPEAIAYRVRSRAIEDRQSTDAMFAQMVIEERLEVLQSFLVLLPAYQKVDVLPSVIRDIKRFAADSNVWLSIQGSPPTLVPLEEPLLQKEVLERLLPRLEAKFPERAADLVRGYHDLLKGEDTNTIFGNAFKALEQVARELSGITQLQLTDKGALEKAFPHLHGTIRETITKLAAHRGDEAGHGRKGPDEYEIRYLLLNICNVALVLLEYKAHRD